MGLLRKLLADRILLALLLFAIVVRIFYYFDNAIPFSFDHGKDSLAILDMLLNLSPKFIGPWTSIPGLYFGPAWYYLLAPFYLLFRFNPVGGAVAMLFLLLIQVYIAYRYFGKYAALILCTAPLWLILTKSAWNPYPMTLVSFGILALLKQSREQRKLSSRSSFGLGIIASFGFHFSAAFAIFYPVIILSHLLIFRVRLNLRQITFAALGFFLPFLPQLLFELRYNFSQTRAVLRYFQEGEDHAFTLEKILEVLRTTFGEIRLGILPEAGYLGTYTSIAAALLATGLVLLFWQHQKDQELRQRFISAALFTFIPVFGFFFLHFNVWYVYAIVPAVVVLVGEILAQAPRWFRMAYVVLLILGPLYMLFQYVALDKSALMLSRGFLPIKLQALDEMEGIAAGRPYASYHYVPDIYDYSYQYLFYWRAVHGHALPTEFSYKPGESNYVVQKSALTSRFPSPTKAPEVIFFVVEKPENEEFLQRWWGQQEYQDILEVRELSPSVTLYVAEPIDYSKE